jgi:hypothetical protein
LRLWGQILFGVFQKIKPIVAVLMFKQTAALTSRHTGFLGNSQPSLQCTLSGLLQYITFTQRAHRQENIGETLKKSVTTGSNVLLTWCCAWKLNTIAFHWQASCHNWTICSKHIAMAPYPHSSLGRQRMPFKLSHLLLHRQQPPPLHKSHRPWKFENCIKEYKYGYKHGYT